VIQCQTNVLPPNLPSHPGNPEIQHPRLPASHGTVPEGDPKGPAGAEDAQTKGLCLQSGGRESDQGVASLRYDERTGPVWRNGELAGRRGRWWRRSTWRVGAAMILCHESFP